MTRAINLELEPDAHRDARLMLNTYTYGYGDTAFATMRESVKLGLAGSVVHASVTLTPDEARVLANQLLQVADVADEHRQRRQSLEEFEEQLLDPDFNASIATFVHPDVLYVEPGQMVEAMRQHPDKLIVARRQEQPA